MRLPGGNKHAPRTQELTAAGSGVDFGTTGAVNRKPLSGPTLRGRVEGVERHPMQRKLPDEYDTQQASEEGSHTPRRVLRLGITATNRKPLGVSGLGGAEGDSRTVPAGGNPGRVFTGVLLVPPEPTPPDRDPEPSARELADRRELRAELATKAPAWTGDAEWSEDMEYVWRVRVRSDIESLTARARRYRRAAQDLVTLDEYGGWPGRFLKRRAPGVRNATITRRALRAVRRDSALWSTDVDWSKSRGRSAPIVVDGPHGSVTLSGRRVELMKASEWADNRARSASMGRADLVATCRGRWRRVACGCGTAELLVGCDQTSLCEWCRKRHWRRWRRRIVRAMGPQLRAAHDAWVKGGRRGYQPGVYLITLTMPHSGDLVTDRKTMGAAWRDLSKAASYGGYHKGARRNADGHPCRGADWVDAKWWGHHAMVYEVTKGTVGDGHMHAHAAVISGWVPYDELRATWERSIPGAVIVDVVSPEDARKKAKERGRKLNAISNAAEYLAKYVTKGVEPAEMTGRKAGEMLVAFRGRRKVTTSAHFWRPLADRSGCPTCKQAHRLVEAPCGIQQHAPAAVLLAAAERSRWRPPRGQVGIRWPA